MLGTAELTSSIISGQAVSATNIQSGTLAVSYGGTGRNSLIKDQLMIGNGTDALIQSQNLTWNNTNNILSIQGTIGIGTTISRSILHLHSNLSGCNMNIHFTDTSTGTTENDGILFGKDNCNNAFIRNLEGLDIYFGTAWQPYPT